MRGGLGLVMRAGAAFFITEGQGMFTDVETFTRHNAQPIATISYSVSRHKGNLARSNKQPKLTISIPTTICGTSKAKAFKLQLGRGDSLGKLRIVGIDAKAKTPGVEPSQHAHFFRWNFGFVPILGEDKFEGEKRPVRKISDDEFEIDVPPSWFEGDTR